MYFIKLKHEKYDFQTCYHQSYASMLVAQPSEDHVANLFFANGGGKVTQGPKQCFAIPANEFSSISTFDGNLVTYEFFSTKDKCENHPATANLKCIRSISKTSAPQGTIFKSVTESVKNIKCSNTIENFNGFAAPVYVRIGAYDYKLWIA